MMNVSFVCVRNGECEAQNKRSTYCIVSRNFIRLFTGSKLPLRTKGNGLILNHVRQVACVLASRRHGGVDVNFRTSRTRALFRAGRPMWKDRSGFIAGVNVTTTAQCQCLHSQNWLENYFKMTLAGFLEKHFCSFFRLLGRSHQPYFRQLLFVKYKALFLTVWFYYITEENRASPCVVPSVWNSLILTGRILMQFDIWALFRNFVGKIKILLKFREV